MKNLNSHGFMAAISVVLLVSACGKNMSLQVPSNQTGQNNGLKTQDHASTSTSSPKSAPSSNSSLVAEKLPSAVAITGELESYSAYDMKELANDIPTNVLLLRSIQHVEPKNAVSTVKTLELDLDTVTFTDIKSASLCLEKECRSLAAFITDSKAKTFKIDLAKLFEFDLTNTEAVMNWIYINSTPFAQPGYRKFRFRFEGISKIDCAEVIYQTTTNDQLPKDFNSAPTCYENGESDLLVSTVSVVSPAASVTATMTKPAATTGSTAEGTSEVGSSDGSAGVSGATSVSVPASKSNYPTCSAETAPVTGSTATPAVKPEVSTPAVATGPKNGTKAPENEK